MLPLYYQKYYSFMLFVTVNTQIHMLLLSIHLPSKIRFSFIYLFACVYVCVCPQMVSVWKSQDNSELVLYFYHIGLGSRTQIIRLSGVHSNPLSNLANLIVFSFWNYFLSLFFPVFCCLVQVLFRDCSLFA